MTSLLKTKLKWWMVSGAACLSSFSANASWLDSDFYCRVYGCVIAHDGFSFDVYDNYNFATGTEIGRNEQMIRWSGNPVQGSGGVNPVITGSRTEGFYNVPVTDQSSILGIDFDGDGVPDRLPNDANNSGFLDAGDSLDPFALTVSTDLVAADTSAQRSFYITSRTDFFLTAEATLIGDSDELNNLDMLENVDFNFGVTRQGVDDGMAFGADARTGNYFRSFNNVDSVADLFGSPRRIMVFRNDIRLRDAADLPSQSIRFDYVYGLGEYDMSMGEGFLQYEIEFDFYNR